jgi:hypothetical protein
VDFGSITVHENWGRLFISKDGITPVVVMQSAYPALVEAIQHFIPPALDAQATPLAEVAMRGAAIGIINAEIKHAHALGAQHHVPVLAAVRRSVEALPTTFTNAELLDAAMQLPEVKALVKKAQVIREFIDVYSGPKTDIMKSKFYAALAPFTRKGE